MLQYTLQICLHTLYEQSIAIKCLKDILIQFLVRSKEAIPINDNDRKSLLQAASAAQSIYGALKTGKAISAAAKGAAVGGPYGAAAAAALATGKHAGKLLAAVAALLMLPVLFILMLPSLIFGGLTCADSSNGVPVLNDGASITENVADLAFSVNQILGEGITDVETRIAQDFASTGGDNYEVRNPYEGNMVSNINSFLAQYCAAKGQDWKAISKADLEQILRQGKTQLYSYTRTSEVRTVEADDPDTEDVVETKDETWYIYTLSYNGEAYFADTVFHLTDAQKELANDYAENLNLFLDNGLF